MYSESLILLLELNYSTLSNSYVFTLSGIILNYRSELLCKHMTKCHFVTFLHSTVHSLKGILVLKSVTLNEAVVRQS